MRRERERLLVGKKREFLLAGILIVLEMPHSSCSCPSQTEMPPPHWMYSPPLEMLVGTLNLPLPTATHELLTDI